MKFGVIFPQYEFPYDGKTLRDYAQLVEGLGYSHILAYDHVLGANPDRPGGWKGPYTHEHQFLEPFVLFSYLASVTQRIEFTTGILILPQRQSVLVAKQAATFDAITGGGRLRLGLGLGWNAVEYEALNEKFSNRGRRIEEQIEVMQRLWADPLVTFDGRWHHISDAGLNPLPVHRRIPIWFGGHHENVLQRIARFGDGWMPNRNAKAIQADLDLLVGFLEKEDRKREDIGLEGRMPFGDGNPDVWKNALAEWNAVGATHITLNTMGAGLDAPRKHLEAIRKFAQEMGVGS